ncbi:MAG: hypothetical protein KDE14_02770 [Rhodobacteraceae bacterium]|nr:hypothetical protein [Paracoccaceae bacterium]
MGQEIDDARFDPADFKTFELRLRTEHQMLSDWFRAGAFSPTTGVGGAELEIWLVDRDGNPAPQNRDFLRHINSPLVAPELSEFNVELNCAPENLSGRGLSRLQSGLEDIWGRVRGVARDMKLGVAMIGILPTVKAGDLTLGHVSRLNRFFALNEQILRARKGKPINLAIEGKDRLSLSHDDVMLEAAATSFQIHYQISQAEAARVYNASKIASGPLVAVSANSPFLFGKDLWAETRIPLFEQAVSVNEWDYSERVTFGVSYLVQSLEECFLSNIQRYPVLLPRLSDDPAARLNHVRLHNGTIWRWNRPLIGYEADGRPHLRIENRVVPAGPTMIDNVANAALYYGVTAALAHQKEPPELDILFSQARDNFYAAARLGLDADFEWFEGRKRKVRDLILEEILPLARQGLAQLRVDDDDAARYIGVIEHRVQRGQNGAAWQRAFVARHGADMNALCLAYLERQDSGEPVHTWTV